MPDEYYRRERQKGEFSRSGIAVYDSVATSQERQLLAVQYPPFSYPPPSMQNLEPQIGMISTIYHPRYPAVRRGCVIVDVTNNGKSVWVIREWGSAIIEFTRRNSGQYVESGVRSSADAPTLLVGHDDATWRKFKVWWERKRVGRPRFP